MDTRALVLSRVKWIPILSTELNLDSGSEPESEYSPWDVTYISSDINSDEEMNKEDGQFFTPPNSPINPNLLPDLTEDEQSDDEESEVEDKKSEVEDTSRSTENPGFPLDLPTLLSDSEDEDEEPETLRMAEPLDTKHNSSIARSSTEDSRPRMTVSGACLVYKCDPVTKSLVDPQPYPDSGEQDGNLNEEVLNELIDALAAQN